MERNKIKSFEEFVKLNEELCFNFDANPVEVILHHPKFDKAWNILVDECGGDYETLCSQLSAQLERECGVEDIIQHIYGMLKGLEFGEDVFIKGIDKIVDYDTFVELTNGLDREMTSELLLQKLMGLKPYQTNITGESPVYLQRLLQIAALKKNQEETEEPE